VGLIGPDAGAYRTPGYYRDQICWKLVPKATSGDSAVQAWLGFSWFDCLAKQGFIAKYGFLVVIGAIWTCISIGLDHCKMDSRLRSIARDFYLEFSTCVETGTQPRASTAPQLLDSRFNVREQ
jgi:hypothetical protein